MGPQREAKNRPRSRNLSKTMKRPVSSPPGGSAVSVGHMAGSNAAEVSLMDLWERALGKKPNSEAIAYIAPGRQISRPTRRPFVH